MRNKEFDPTTEKHHFGFVVKAIDPGCTLELQIEDNLGNVTRITSTENRDMDYTVMQKALYETFIAWFNRTF